MVKLYSAQLSGLDATIVTVEVDLSPGLHIFSIVGLADKEVQESRERIGAAVKNIGGRAPHKKAQRVIINLAPADIKKEGPAFDLPIALGYLLASEQTKFDPEKKLFLGELGLDGALRPIRGVLAAAFAAREKGLNIVYVPKGNGDEAALVGEIKVKEVGTLLELLDDLEGKKEIPAYKTKPAGKNRAALSDFSLIKGQEEAKRALEISAAGGHNILMQGPPGTGKTILARALPSILPELTKEELIDVAKIRSAAGLLKDGNPFRLERPFRSPHHTSSPVAVAGGGNPIRPGEITMAHHGVLFLDELPEFQANVLEALREPLEDRVITISRARGTIAFPAHIILVGAMNPCPCGHYNNPPHECVCTPGQIGKYQRKISGPLLDRIDLFILVPQVEIKKIDEKEGPQTEVDALRRKIELARKIQRERFGKSATSANAAMGLREIKKYCPLDERTKQVLRQAYRQHNMSVRSYYRTIKVARTIADLAGAENIESEHLSEALQYRTKTGA